MSDLAVEAATGVLRGRVVEQGQATLLPCWVALISDDGTLWGADQLLAGPRGLPCEGAFEYELPSGQWRVRIWVPLSHCEIDATIDLAAGETVERIWETVPWVPLKKMNIVAGESHNHLRVCFEPIDVVRYAQATGLNYINACQPWLCTAEAHGDWTGDEIERYLAQANTESFALHFGAERPKTRYGHVWWLNLPPFDAPFGEYASWHDSAYVNHVAADGTDPGDIEAVCPLQTELPLDTWRRYRRQGGACVAAHPTSWWLERPDDELIVTNIAAELPFALLSGEAPDALVVMGYDADQVFYQNVWFHLLNAGYLLAGCGETDGSLGGHHAIGQIITYTRLLPGESYNPMALVDALRTGRSVISSGPFVRLTGDGERVQAGDRVIADGQPHTLRVEAWSAPDQDEALSWVIIYRNGMPWRVEDLRANPQRHIELEFDVADHTYAWYLAKVYGRQGPTSATDLDVFAYTEHCLLNGATEYSNWSQVALTNPVFFLPADWQAPKPVTCEVLLQVEDSAGQPLVNRRVSVYEDGAQKAQARTDQTGRVALTMQPTAEIEVETGRGDLDRRSIFLHYRPVNECMESLYAGRWRREYPHAQPGQVPWSAFRLDDLRSKLERIAWRWVVKGAACKMAQVDTEVDPPENKLKNF